jgi:hypothetical protein
MLECERNPYAEFLNLQTCNLSVIFHVQFHLFYLLDKINLTMKYATL